MISVDPDTVLELAKIALLAAAFAYLQQRYRLTQYLFFLRLPLMHVLVLVLLPLAVRTRAFGNLFVLTPPQLAVVAFLLIVSTSAATYASGLLFVGAAPRFRLRFEQPDVGEAKDRDDNPPPNKLITLLAGRKRQALHRAIRSGVARAADLPVAVDIADVAGGACDRCRGESCLRPARGWPTGSGTDSGGGCTSRRHRSRRAACWIFDGASGKPVTGSARRWSGVRSSPCSRAATRSSRPTSGKRPEHRCRSRRPPSATGGLSVSSPSC